MQRLMTLTVAAAVLSLVSTGCSEQVEVTMYEPGVYKGGIDPLLAKQTDPAHIERLRERFVQGQTDR